MRLFPLFLVLLLVAPACGRKKQPPPAPPPVSQTPVGPPKIQAPPGVPQALKDLVQKEWDKIAKEGELFLVKFKEAETARTNDDRSAMDAAIEEANEHYQRAVDMWADIAYWADNEVGDGKIDERTAEECNKWLGTLGYGNGFGRHGPRYSRSIRNLDATGGGDVALHVTGHDDVSRPYRALPKPAPREHQGAVDFAIALHLAINLEIAVAGNYPHDPAALADERGSAGGTAADTSTAGFTHALSAPF